jgi:enoyl-CoA hydratase/carnithine racemase
MWEAVPILLDQAEKDDAIRMVVFSGQGPKSFASGADISQFEDMRAAREAVKKYEHMAENALMGLYRFSKPVVAAIQGYCIGGGLNMAISCDIRIASSDSVSPIPRRASASATASQPSRTSWTSSAPAPRRTSSIPAAASMRRKRRASVS